MNVRQDAAGRDRDGAQQFGQFFVVSDRELDVSRYDSGLLVVSRGVTGEFQDFCGEIFEHCGEVDRGTGTYTSREFPDFQESRNSPDWELQTGFRGSRNGFLR